MVLVSPCPWLGPLYIVLMSFVIGDKAVSNGLRSISLAILDLLYWGGSASVPLFILETQIVEIHA